LNYYVEFKLCRSERKIIVIN